MNVAVIGCGNWGFRVGKAIAEHPLMSVGLAVEPNTHQHQNIHDAMMPDAVTEDIEQGIDALQACDAAVVATPPDSGRFAQVKQLINYGIQQIRIEKPVALRLSEIHAIQDAADSFPNVKFTVGHTPLYEDAWPFVRGVLAAQREEIGQLHFQRLSQVGTNHPSSALKDLAPHDLAYLFQIYNPSSLGVKSVDENRMVLEQATMFAKVPKVIIDYTWEAKAKKRGMAAFNHDGETLMTYNEMNGVVTVGPDPYHFESGRGLQNELDAWTRGEGTDLWLGGAVASTTVEAARDLEHAHS